MNGTIRENNLIISFYIKKTKTKKMNKYCIDYIAKNGNVYCVWVIADNEVEAEAVAKSEYSDINNVINVVKYN